MAYSNYPQTAVNAAKRALKHKEEYGSKCGTAVGWRSAGIISNKQPLTLDRLKRVFSFLSRAKVYDTGKFLNDGKEVCGSVMYAAWGGTTMLRWARKELEKLEKEERQEITGKAKTALENKVEEHNESVRSEVRKTNLRTLSAVFKRGIGAYKTNPESVRPSVKSPEMWAMARVNSFLYALKNDKFRSGKHDTDLFPEGHKLKSKMEDDNKERARVGMVDGVPVYDNKEEAEAKAEDLGCSGSHSMELEGKTVYMPCSSHSGATDDDNGNGYRQAEGVVHKRTQQADFELRESKKGSTIVGYAAVFNTETQIGNFREQIAPEAFNRALTESPDVVALLNHDRNFVLGRTTSDTLKLSVDERGLKYELKLGNQSYAKDLAESMRRGDISQSSFAFTIERESWEDDLRTVEEVRGLYDVSVVTVPAYAEASATIRAKESCGCKKEEIKDATVVEEKSTPEVRATSTPKKIIKNKFKMKKSDQLKSLRSNKLVELNALVEVAETEARDYTDAELTRQEQLNSDIAELDKSIERAETTENNVKRHANVNATPKGEAVEMNKMNKRYDMGKALREAAQGRLSGLEQEIHQEALREASAFGIQLRGNVCIPQSFVEKRNVYGNDASGTPDTAVGTAGTEAAEVAPSLRATPVIQELGATQLTGFVGDVKLPSLPNDKASLPAEAAAATAFSGSMSSVTLSPQRFAAEMTITKEALNQATGNMQDVIARDFSVAIGNSIDRYAFAKICNGSIEGTQLELVPTNSEFAAGQGTLVQSIESGTNDLAAVDTAAVMNLWADITGNGIGDNAAFVMSPAVAGALMQANVTGDGGPAALVGNSLMGYNARWTSNIPNVQGTNIHADAIFSGGGNDVDLGAAFVSSVMFYGDFSQLFWCQWGGYSLTVDPFSGASAGTVKLVADNYFDVGLRDSGAIGYMLANSVAVAGADS